MVYFLWSLTHLVANQSIKMALKPKQGGSGDYGPKQDWGRGNLGIL